MSLEAIEPGPTWVLAKTGRTALRWSEALYYWLKLRTMAACRRSGLWTSSPRVSSIRQLPTIKTDQRQAATETFDAQKTDSGPNDPLLYPQQLGRGIRTLDIQLRKRSRWNAARATASVTSCTTNMTQDKHFASHCIDFIRFHCKSYHVYVSQRRSWRQSNVRVTKWNNVLGVIGVGQML